MYTAKILRKTLIKKTRKTEVDVAYFFDGVELFTEVLELPSNSDKYDIAHRIKNEIKKMELSETSFNTIPEGELDLTLAEALEPSVAEQTKRQWFSDFSRLEKLNKLQQLGALPADKQDNLENLKAKVATGFKASYVSEM